MRCVGPPLLSLSETPLQSRPQMPRDCGVYPIGLTEGEPTIDRIQFLVDSCTRDSAYFWLLDIYTATGSLPAAHLHQDCVYLLLGEEEFLKDGRRTLEIACPISRVG